MAKLPTTQADVIAYYRKKRIKKTLPQKYNIKKVDETCDKGKQGEMSKVCEAR